MWPLVLTCRAPVGPCWGEHRLDWGSAPSRLGSLDHVMRIRRVHVENFMSLRSADIELEPLTVFVGPNGSGKSGIFRALVTVSRLLHGAPLRSERGEFALEQGVTFDDLVWRGNSGLPIGFRIWFEGDPDDDPSYEVTLVKRAEGWGVARERFRLDDRVVEVDDGHPFEYPTESQGLKLLRTPLRASLRTLVNFSANDSVSRPYLEPILGIAERLGQSWRYRPSASDIAAFVAPPSGQKERSQQDRNFVRENGRGLALELQSLQGADRPTFSSIEADLASTFPHIRSLGFKADWQGVRITYSTTRSEDPVPAPLESDGVLLATFLLWRLHTGGQSIRVCLEEPESGLHPDLIEARFALLKRFADPTRGAHAVQILVSTQSKEFVRSVKSHPAEFTRILRSVEFDPEVGTTAGGFAHYPDTARFADRYLDNTVVRGTDA